MTSDDLQAEAELPPVQTRQHRKPVDAGAKTRGSKYFFRLKLRFVLQIFTFWEHIPDPLDLLNI